VTGRYGVLEKIMIDGSEANAAAIRRYDRGHGTGIAIRQVKYLYWSEEEVFFFLRKCDVLPNPLYAFGFKQVGCFPCIAVHLRPFGASGARRLHSETQE
jgi:hypothetical protein